MQAKGIRVLLNSSAGWRCLLLRMSHSAAIQKGKGVEHQSQLGLSTLVDTLLLSRCDFLLKPKSAVSEFAIYYSPRLINASYDFELRGQPEPKAAWWMSQGS